MELKLVNRIIDDNGIEVKENDDVLIQTKDMDDFSMATVLEIRTNVFTVRFRDRLLGYMEQKLRPADVTMLTKYS